MANEIEVKAYDNWMGSIETANIIITTPKGSILAMEKVEPVKNKYKWSESAEAKKLVWRVYELICEEKKKPEQKGFTYKIKLTKEEILLWALYSNKQYNS